MALIRKDQSYGADPGTVVDLYLQLSYAMIEPGDSCLMGWLRRTHRLCTKINHIGEAGRTAAIEESDNDMARIVRGIRNPHNLSQETAREWWRFFANMYKPRHYLRMRRIMIGHFEDDADADQSAIVVESFITMMARVQYSNNFGYIHVEVIDKHGTAVVILMRLPSLKDSGVVSGVWRDYRVPAIILDSRAILFDTYLGATVSVDDFISLLVSHMDSKMIGRGNRATLTMHVITGDREDIDWIRDFSLGDD